MTNPLPIECRARYEEITNRAKELLESFICGNRKTVLLALEEMEPKTALAVLSEMMVRSGSEMKNINGFLKAMA
jgi:predicted transcriptional regulator